VNVARWGVLAVLIVGCKGESSNLAPPAPPPPPPPPQPAPAPPPVAADTTRPRQIPREALAHRDNFIRIWRFYFALAQPPTIGFSQVHQESRWKTDARSPYASGMAQFTPATAAQYAMLLPPEVRARCPTTAGCPTDPNWALNALSLYDYNLHKGYSWAATGEDRWRLTLAAYNGGAHWLKRERVKANNSTRWADIAAACIRSTASCKENHDYPVLIIEKWLPVYRRWLGF
jgi:soluble lytic murein transglycosylase-like protein